MVEILSVWSNVTFEGGRPALKVSWTSNGIEAITHYKVTIEHDGSTTSETTKINSVVLENPGLTYRVLVIPFTEHGEGESSGWRLVGSVSGGGMWKNN